jgi:hypothetical protein
LFLTQPLAASVEIGGGRRSTVAAARRRTIPW